MTVLNSELLQGRAVALAGPASPELAGALSSLGARVEVLEPAVETEEERVGEWARAHRPLDALVYDARPSFAAGGLEALVGMTQEAWQAVREVAVGALLEADRPGKIVLLAPRPNAGPHSEAARSALENLARTLSVEWARHGVTVVAVAPGRRTSETDLAELACFLCSRAAAYLSGCRLELGAVDQAGASAHGTTTASS